MKPCYYFPLLLLFLAIHTGCRVKGENEHSEEYAAITNFNLQPEALKDGDRVRLLYCSATKPLHPEKKYMVQLVAVKTSSQDTVNIISYSSDHLTPNDGEKIYRFRSMEKELAYKIIRSRKKQQKIKDGDYESATVMDNDILWVIRDTKFNIAKYDYPTVVGELIR